MLCIKVEFGTFACAGIGDDTLLTDAELGTAPEGDPMLLKDLPEKPHSCETASGAGTLVVRLNGEKSSLTCRSLSRGDGRWLAVPKKGLTGRAGCGGTIGAAEGTAIVGGAAAVSVAGAAAVAPGWKLAAPGLNTNAGAAALNLVVPVDEDAAGVAAAG